ncbi:MAG: hypothetical protein ACK4PR_05095, partial [Gammaproteobacteria bacterium]
TILNSNQIAIGSYHGTIKILNLQTGFCEKNFIGHGKAVVCLTVLRDEMLVSVGADETLKVWDVQNKKCRNTYGCEGLRCLIALANGDLVSSHKDETIRIWKKTDCQLILLPRLPDNQLVPPVEVALKHDSNSTRFVKKEVLISNIDDMLNELGLKDSFRLAKVRINNDKVGVSTPAAKEQAPAAKLLIKFSMLNTSTTKTNIAKNISVDSCSPNINNFK